MKTIIVSDKITQEAKNLVNGVYSPLGGFLNLKEMKSVLNDMRLPGGEVWSMPIIFDVNEEEKKQLWGEEEFKVIGEKEGEEFIIKNIEIYKFDKKYFVGKLFGTSKKEHPGVQETLKMGDWLVGGRIFPVKESIYDNFFFSPSRSREFFKEKEWKTIVAFQTRNAPHCSHEHLQKCGLNEADGLFIQPIIGPKKIGDFKDDHIMGAYQLLIEKYFPKDRAMLGIFKTFMRYAGPKEAVFHALVRKNFGCTHMIIGRDHAGVGDFYGTFDAQKIFENFSEKELGVRILKYDNASFCKECKKVVFDCDCPHENSNKIFLSGTELRRKLLNNEDIPEEFMRREIKEYLLNNKDNLFVK